MQLRAEQYAFQQRMQSRAVKKQKEEQQIAKSKKDKEEARVSRVAKAFHQHQEVGWSSE